MDNDTASSLMIGVVEGFYGRPWTLEQREKLFSRLAEWGMTSYMYAPKDDIKHRAGWRELYTPSEAGGIGRLIKACRRNNIEFIYAISPGLDIGFADPQELDALKAKVDQVVSLGCSAFALLFDDIDDDLNSEDKAVFGTFGNCQVYIANALYNHLNQPKTFLFCPTEYCAARALPSVCTSPYLRTLGEGLAPDIAVLWTGPKVVSHSITVKSLSTVRKALQRRPVIWDNLHANDYDQRRLFLGPYANRPVEINLHIRGVLTNPNCEYEANYVAIRTLAMWANAALACSPVSDDPDDDLATRSSTSLTLHADNVSQLSEESMRTETETADIVMETETTEESTEDADAAHPRRRTQQGQEQGGDGEQRSADFMPAYDPKAALHEALTEWLVDFHRPCSFNLSSALSRLQAEAEDAARGRGSTLAQRVSSSSQGETSAGTSSPPRSDRAPESGVRSPVAVSDATAVAAGSLSPRRTTSTPFSLSHLELLADLFFLPNDYGAHGRDLMQQFRWLRAHYRSYADFSNAALDRDDNDDDEVAAADDLATVAGGAHASDDGAREPADSDASSNSSGRYDSDADLSTAGKAALCKDWRWHAAEFHRKCACVKAMFDSLTEIPNRPLLYDLYTYVWDVKEVVVMLDEYLTWLEETKNAGRSAAHFYPDDAEAWVFRGGMAGELTRFLPEPERPKGSSGRLKKTKSKSPDFSLFTIRPYLPSDERSMYDVCLLTGDSGQDGTALFPHFPDILGHRYVGPYTNLSVEFAFVVEDADGVCGYVLGALDSRFFYKRYQAEWVPAIKKKYANKALLSDLTKSEAEVWKDLTEGEPFLPSQLAEEYPSHLHIDLLPRAQSKGVGKRMMRFLLKALRSKGSRGVHLEMSSTNERALGFYKKLGFVEADVAHVPDGCLVLCKTL